jgi:hypothetical protein
MALKTKEEHKPLACFLFRWIGNRLRSGFGWCQERWCEQLDKKEKVQIRTDQPLELEEAA